MPVHGSVVPLSSGWQKRMYHWIMQPATSAIPRTHVTHHCGEARARARFFFFHILRRIAHRERRAFTRRAQYLEDRVLPSLPSFAPFHPSTSALFPPGAWVVDLTWWNTYAGPYADSEPYAAFRWEDFTEAPLRWKGVDGGERPDENMKAWRAREKKRVRRKEARIHMQKESHAHWTVFLSPSPFERSSFSPFVMCTREMSFIRTAGESLFLRWIRSFLLFLFVPFVCLLRSGSIVHSHPVFSRNIGRA